MRGTFQIIKMDIQNLLKNPILLSGNTVLPVLLVLIMGFLRSGEYASVTSAYNYYFVAFIVYCMLNGAMTASNCFMERDIKKPNLRIIHSPIGSFPIYFSKIVASSLYNYACHLLVMAVLCPVLGLNLGGSKAVFIALLMIPVEFAACALGTLFCCIFKSEETTSSLLSIVIGIIAFLGGVFFSLDGLGSLLSTVSRLSPVKWLIDGFFSIIYDGNLTPAIPIFVISTILSVLLVAACSKFFKTEDYLC